MSLRFRRSSLDPYEWFVYRSDNPAQAVGLVRRATGGCWLDAGSSASPSFPSRCSAAHASVAAFDGRVAAREARVLRSPLPQSVRLWRF